MSNSTILKKMSRKVCKIQQAKKEGRRITAIANVGGVNRRWKKEKRENENICECDCCHTHPLLSAILIFADPAL